ncbi:hypothetical protein ONZ43_g3346 [Nemania bipapillata]|uniref:Uncharacterized protein n=1 Tax=Nemania bipapillata TaxID=110536 RepID=A0ACC2IX62_9PEZI|nr:hypothetical protein ONZ43_g3346 [Nemania bipapillata]
MTRITSRAVHQPGFSFGRKVFQGNEILASRFYAVVVGPAGSIGLEELRSRVETKMRDVFSICLKHSEFYSVARGSDVFWNFVAEQWDTVDFVEPADVAAFVDGYCTAREKCVPGIRAKAGELAKLVDNFIDIRNIMLTRSPEQKLRLVIRPSPVTQATQGLANLVLGNPSPATPWPPSHFTDQEVAWFSHDHVLSQVYGLDTETE